MSRVLTVVAVVAFLAGMAFTIEFSIWRECLQDHSILYCVRVLDR